MNSEDEFLNFAVGPVQMSKEILEISTKQLPYFRTNEFSKINLENENLIKKITKASVDSRAIFLTASGTGAMEATIQNLFNTKDKVLIVNGGSFGERFKQICEIHNIAYEEIKLNYGEFLTQKHLKYFKNKNFTGFLVNVHETSTGVLYDINIIKEFCEKENLLLVVDAISSFLSDKYEMEQNNIDVTILSSQKSLALPPGLSIVILNTRAINKINMNTPKTLYFNLKDYLLNGERGQTPFTPAVGILLQLNKRLKVINNKGTNYFIKRTEKIANDFREKIIKLPFKISHKNLSNTLTPLEPLGKMKANEIFDYLKNNYNIYLCPNGGELKEKLIRVGHIGEISIKDNDVLINAFREMQEGGLL